MLYCCYLIQLGTEAYDFISVVELERRLVRDRSLNVYKVYQIYTNGCVKRMALKN